MNDKLPDEVAVDPGEIDQFAERMKTAAEFWWEKEGGPRKLTEANDGDPHYPFVGEYGEADSFRSSHLEDKWKPMSIAFQQLHALLEGLEEGCKQVAQQYRDLEALNTTDADALGSLIGPEVQDSMKDVPKSQDGGNDQQPTA